MTSLNLKYLNLSKKETEVYLSLLENSPQTVVELSRTLKISRTGLYKILKSTYCWFVKRSFEFSN